MNQLFAKYKTLDGDFSHTCFTNKSTLKLKIPQEDLDTFYDKYYECHSEFSGCITEKSKDPLVFFADIDLPMEAFTNDILPKEDILCFMKACIKTFKDVILDFTGIESDVISAFRLVYKCHLHFPNIILSPIRCRQVTLETQARIAIEFPWINVLQNKFKKNVFDTSVYSSGLRLLGSSKVNLSGIDKVRKDLSDHQKIFTETFRDHYLIGNIDGEKIIFKPLERSDLDKVSIINRGVVSSPWKGPIIPEKRKAKECHPKLNTTGNPLIRYLKLQLQKIDYSINFDWIPKVKVLDAAISVELPCTNPCPFAKRFHTRSSERGIPANYVLITAFDATVRCWKCADKLPLQNVPSEIQSDLENQTPNFLLKKSLYHQTHENISQFIFSLVKSNFAASRASGSAFLFYYFEDSVSRWIQGEKLTLMITSGNGEIQNQYRQYIDSLLENASDDDIAATKEIWKKLETSLQTFAFVNAGILPMLARKLEQYWGTIGMKNNEILSFQSKLDSNPLLLGFQNGVYDFSSNKFRECLPSDFVSMSTFTKYHHYESFPLEIRVELENYLSKIFVKKNHLLFFLEQLASCLNGVSGDQKFHILTGCGANGKSLLVKLINYALGDYAGEVNVTLFTKPRPPANVPSPELIQIKGKRVCTSSEPDQKDSFNLGTMKWLSGNDRITAAQKFEQNQSFYLQCGWFILTNDIPEISAGKDDWGTWRRILPIPFYSRFVQSLPANHKVNEFQADPSIEAKLETWNEVFIALLIKIYNERSKRFPTPLPVEFKNAWKKLQNKNDLYSRFVDESIEINEHSSFTTSNAMFISFQSWVKTFFPNKKVDMDLFVKNMKTILGNLVENDKNGRGWNVQLREVLMSQYC